MVRNASGTGSSASVTGGSGAYAGVHSADSVNPRFHAWDEVWGEPASHLVEVYPYGAVKPRGNVNVYISADGKCPEPYFTRAMKSKRADIKIGVFDAAVSKTKIAGCKPSSSACRGVLRAGLCLTASHPSSVRRPAVARAAGR